MINFISTEETSSLGTGHLKLQQEFVTSHHTPSTFLDSLSYYLQNYSSLTHKAKSLLLFTEYPHLQKSLFDWIEVLIILANFEFKLSEVLLGSQHFK